MGTPAVTARGFKEAEMETVGQLICAVAKDDFSGRIDQLQEQVKTLTGRFKCIFPSIRRNRTRAATRLGGRVCMMKQRGNAQ